MRAASDLNILQVQTHLTTHAHQITGQLVAFHNAVTGGDGCGDRENGSEKQLYPGQAALLLRRSLWHLSGFAYRWDQSSHWAISSK
jgi:hypothetical protein